MNNENTGAVKMRPLGSGRHDAFWSASPRWKQEAVRVEVDGELVVWHDTNQFALDRVATALAVHFDGILSLGELVTDLVEALELFEDDARALISAATIELASTGAIEGVPELGPDLEGAAPAAETSQDGPAADQEPGPEMANAPASGAGVPRGDSSPEVIRVETTVDSDGNEVVVEHLSDGRRRVTTSVSLSLHDDASAALFQAAMAGDRSPAELAPIDSCLGSKLRNLEEVPLLNVRCSDGRVRSIRCHDPAVAEVLAERYGQALAVDERGPIAAFVVTPLEGDGPRRVFDGLGRRRGRPRSIEEVADLVDQILGEATIVGSGWGPEVPLALDLVALSRHGEQVVLVPSEVLHARGVIGALRASGWIASATEVSLDLHGRVSIPTAVSTIGSKPLHEPVIAMGRAGLTSAQKVRMLMRPMIVPVEHRAQIIRRLAELAGAATWVPFDGPLASVLAEVSA